MRLTPYLITLLFLLSLTFNPVSPQIVDPDPDPSTQPPPVNPINIFTFSLIEGKKYLSAATLSFVQLLYEIVITDAIDCVNYSIVIYEHLYDSVI
jgi:hypothetical protein